MARRKKIVVIIPAYNESATVSSVVLKVKKVLPAAKILVIDDGSTDTTAETARKAGATLVPHRTRFGLAEAYRTGCRAALKKKADIVVTIDADQQYDAKDIPQLISPVIRREADLALGWRKHKEYMPLSKRIGNFLFAWAISFICGKKINDPQTGFRAFTKEVAAFDVLSDFSYTQEVIIRAARNGFRIAEVPVAFYKRQHGPSRLFSNVLIYALRAGINIIRLMISYAPLRFFGGASVLLLAVSLINGFILQNDLLGLGFFLAALQVLFFGFLADLFVQRH